MLLPSHMENVVHVMAETSTLVACPRSRRLVQLAYVNDEAKQGNEEDSENE